MLRSPPGAFPIARRLALAAFALTLARRLPAQAPAAEAGFVSLFNGHDLAGWDGNPQLWSVQDGAILGRRVKAERPDKGNTFLIWQGGLVRNFELHAAFRLMAENDRHWANSGIQYRSQVIDPVHWVVRGYQADMDESGGYVGQIYEEGYRGFLAQPGQSVRVLPGESTPFIALLGRTASPEEVRNAYHRDDWNEYVILAQGHHIRQWLNGVLTAEVDDWDTNHAATWGVLALQLHAGLPMAVEFKNIELKVLP